MKLKIITPDNGNFQTRPKVLLISSESEQIDQRIVQSVFSSVYCSILMLDKNIEEMTETDMEQLENVFLAVVPVTASLLQKQSFLKDIFLPFIDRNRLPVLPILSDSSRIDDYAEVFGDLQFIELEPDPLKGKTLEGKMEEYLDKMFVSLDVIEKIQSSFRLHLFISYRKKDWQYAQNLMGYLQSLETSWDVALWYDDYLIPGEDFNQVIKENLEKSEVFTLLVTPALEEENYISKQEYPLALDAEKTIIPIEMESADSEKLARLYKDLPEIRSVSDPVLRKRLNRLLQSDTSFDGSDPSKLYYLGLALLKGINKKRNGEKAEMLIGQAAEKGYIEAFKKLSEMYFSGDGVRRNYRTALTYAKRYLFRCAEQFVNRRDQEHALQLYLALKGYLQDLIHLGLYKEAEKEVNDSLLPIMQALKESQFDVYPLTVLLFSTLGQVKEAQGNYEEALRAYRSLTNILADRLEESVELLDVYWKAWYDRISILQKQNHLSEARRTLNAFKKTLNDSTGADVYSTRLKWEAYLTGLEATLLCEEKDMDGVSNLLNKIEDMIQNSTTGYAFCKEYLEKTDLMLKAWLSMEQEDYVQSTRTLRQLEKILLDKGAYLSPSDQSSLAHIYRLMGENYMRLNKPACARSYFEKAIKRISDIQNRTRDDNLEMILCLYGLGESHSLTGSEKQAKSCYQIALLKMQDCTVEKNQLNKDKIDSEKVSMRFPEAAASIRKAGLFFERQRDPERAIQFYREALNQLNAFPANSDHPDSLENVLESDMGRIFYGSGDLETALGHFEKSVQSARKDYDLRRDDLSLQNLFTALSNAALCALQSGDHIRALKHFVSWWKIRSVLSAEDCASCDTLLQDEMILKNIADLYHQQEDEESEAVYRRILLKRLQKLYKLDPDPDTRTRLENCAIRIITICQHQNIAQAEPELEFLIPRIEEDLEEENSTELTLFLAILKYQYGQVLYIQDRDSEALRVLYEASALFEKTSDTAEYEDYRFRHYSLLVLAGRSCMNLKDYEQAKNVLLEDSALVEKDIFRFYGRSPQNDKYTWENCCIVNGYLAKALIPLEAYDLLCSKTQRVIDLFCQIGNLENENDFSEVLGFVDTIVDHLESAPLEYQLRVSGIGIELILGKLRKAWNSDVFKKLKQRLSFPFRKAKAAAWKSGLFAVYQEQMEIFDSLYERYGLPVIQAERGKAAYLAGSCFFDLHEFEIALQIFNEVLEGFQNLYLTENGLSKQYLEAWMNTYDRLGDMYSRTGEWQNAEASYHHAIQLARKKLQCEHADVFDERDLGITELHYGISLAEQNYVQEALSIFTRLQPRFQALAERKKQRLYYRDLDNLNYWLSLICKKAGLREVSNTKDPVSSEDPKASASKQ